MATTKKTVDQYANKFYATVTESAANTLKFQEIQTNINIMDKVAWVVHKLEWFIPTASLVQVGDVGDVLQVALTMSNKITALSLSDAAVIDMAEISIHLATAVGFEMNLMPIVRDFTGLPGGGLIIPPRPLYIAINSTSIAGTLTAEVRGAFTAIDLGPEGYYDLLDAYRIIQ